MSADKIRELNDQFRTSMAGGRVMITAGVDALTQPIRHAVIEKVRGFTDFKEENDPHGEHDMGFFDVGSEHFIWKIDYYDPQCNMGSDDPADPEKTTRVLTIMLAEEY